MATLDAALWLLIKEKAEASLIHDKFTTKYRQDQQLDYLWLYLYFATQSDHQEIVKSILHQSHPYLVEIAHVLNKSILATCLNEAVRKENVEMIRIYLNYDPTLCAPEGNLYVADSRFKLNFTPIGLAIHQDNAALLQVMIEYYSGETLGSDQHVPLHLACKYPSTKCLQLLLSHEKSLKCINNKDIDGWTPLLFAAMYHPDAIPALVEHGADVTASRRKTGNALQILSNWSIKDRSSTGTKYSGDDPCPTLDRRLRYINTSNDVVFISDNILVGMKALVEGGIDVNADPPPLRNFANNIQKRLAEVLGSRRVCNIFKDAMGYLASISSQEVNEGALFDLCRAVNFVATQLRRSRDYDNACGYVSLLPLIKELISILLERGGARVNYKEMAETGEKKIRSFQYIIPFNLACSASLKKLTTGEYTEQTESTKYNSPSDIILMAVMNLYVVQLEEPELYTEAMGMIHDIHCTLSKSGSRCLQTFYMFTCLSIDPKVNLPILYKYLDSLNQEQYHHMLTSLQEYISSIEQEDRRHFSSIIDALWNCQNRMYSLKHLLRRDLVSLLGGNQYDVKTHVDTLPLPVTLKSYVLEFWD